VTVRAVYFEPIDNSWSDARLRQNLRPEKAIDCKAIDRCEDREHAGIDRNELRMTAFEMTKVDVAAFHQTRLSQYESNPLKSRLPAAPGQPPIDPAATISDTGVIAHRVMREKNCLFFCEELITGG